MGSIARIISNTFYLTLDWAVLTLGGYVYWILMSKTLSVADIGNFSTIFNTALFIVGVSGLGMSIAVTRMFPEYQLKNNLPAISSTISWTLKVTTFATTVVGLVMLFAISLFGPYGVLTTINVAAVLSIMVLTNLVYMTTSYLYGLQKMKEILFSDSFLTVLKILATIPLIFLGFGYAGPIFGFLLAAAATFLLRWTWLPKGVDSVDKKKVWFYSIPVLVSTLGTVAINQGSIVMLGIFSTATNAGLFSILFYITSPIRMIPQLIAQGMFPTTSQKWVANEIKQVQKIISRAVKYSLFLTTPIILALAIFPKDIIILFTTSDYLSVSEAFVYIAVAYLFLGMATIFNSMLYSVGEVASFRNSNLVGGFVNIVLGAVAILNFGINGAVIGFLVATFSMLISGFYFIRKKIPLEIKGSDIIKLVIAAAAFVLVSTLISYQWHPLAWLMGLFLASVVYLAALLLFGFFDRLDLRIVEELEKRYSGNKKKLATKIKIFLERFVS